MHIDLNDRRAFIVGGSRGLGAGIARSLARAGAHVGITSRSRDAAAKTSQAMNREFHEERVEGWSLDVADPKVIHRAIAAFAEGAGGLDIVVYSAGTAVTQKALDMEEDDWDTVLDTNLRGAFFALQKAARLMKDQKGGCLINLASVLGLQTPRSLASYSVSKAGLMQLTRVLAYELGGDGVRVNSVAPGYVLTDMNRDELSKPGVTERLERKTPLGRLAEVEDVANAVTFLCSAQASFITGQVLVVDGGFTL